jgi:hypothetical protein
VPGRSLRSPTSDQDVVSFIPRVGFLSRWSWGEPRDTWRAVMARGI